MKAIRILLYVVLVVISINTARAQQAQDSNAPVQVPTPTANENASAPSAPPTPTAVQNGSTDPVKMAPESKPAAGPKYTSMESASLRKQVADLTTANATLTTQVVSMTAEIRQLKADLAQALAWKQGAENRASLAYTSQRVAETTRDQLKDELKEVQTGIAGVKKSLDSEVEEQRRLKSQVGLLEKGHEAAIQQQADLQAQNDELKTDLAMANSNHKLLQGEYDDLVRIAAGMKRELEALALKPSERPPKAPTPEPSETPPAELAERTKDNPPPQAEIPELPLAEIAGVPASSSGAKADAPTPKARKYLMAQGPRPDGKDVYYWWEDDKGRRWPKPETPSSLRGHVTDMPGGEKGLGKACICSPTGPDSPVKNPEGQGGVTEKGLHYLDQEVASQVFPDLTQVKLKEGGQSYSQVP